MFRELLIRCPRLGGEVTLAYCEQEDGTLPCRRMMHCWSWRLPAVERYLRAKLGDEEWERCFNDAPKEKMSSIVEMAAAARGRCQGGG
jgi:hypothetical protein